MDRRGFLKTLPGLVGAAIFGGALWQAAAGVGVAPNLPAAKKGTGRSRHDHWHARHEDHVHWHKGDPYLECGKCGIGYKLDPGWNDVTCYRCGRSWGIRPESGGVDSAPAHFSYRYIPPADEG